MNRMVIPLLAVWACVPAYAQHEGHPLEATPNASATEDDGHADHEVPDRDADSHSGHESTASEDPHSGHESTPSDDSHSGHQSTPSEDSHSGHEAAPPSADIQSDRDAAEPIANLDAGPGAPPTAAFAGPRHAADSVFDTDVMAAARMQLRREEGAFKTSMVLADRFETRFSRGEEEYLWDIQGWYGGDIHKVWLKSEGEGALEDNPEQAELQALYSRAITPFFDFQTGVRYDARPSPARSHLVVGVQGLLPYVFEIDAAAFVSDEGDLSGRFEAEYDLRINQRLVLQPRMELGFAAQSTPELGIGTGVVAVEGGLRLRYEVRRELAPYVGIAWERKLGGTADFARVAGEDVRDWEWVLGVRAWF